MARRMRIARVSDLSVDDLPSPLVLLAKPGVLATGHHVLRERYALGELFCVCAASPSFASRSASIDGRPRAARRGRPRSVRCMLQRGQPYREGFAAIERGGRG